jgi:hypothetical protein
MPQVNEAHVGSTLRSEKAYCYEFLWEPLRIPCIISFDR